MRTLTIDCSAVTDAGPRDRDESGIASYLLTIRSPKVTGSGFQHLDRMENLRVLRISCPNLTDAGLKFAASNKTLRKLDLDCLAVSKGGIGLLKDSPLSESPASENQTSLRI